MMAVINSRITYRMIFILGVGFSAIGLAILIILLILASYIGDNSLKAVSKKGDLVLEKMEKNISIRAGLMSGEKGPVKKEKVKPLLGPATNEIMEDPDLLYVVIYDSDAAQTILYSVNNKNSGIELGDFPDWPELSRGSTATVVKEVASVIGPHALDMSMPIVSVTTKKDENGVETNTSTLLGWVRIGLSTDHIQTIKSSIVSVWYYIMALLILFSVIIVYLLNSAFAKPVRGMAEITRSLGEGDLDSDIDESRNDEIGDLAMAFNEMTRNIKAQMERTETLADRIQDTVDAIKQSTEDMFAISAEQSSGATEQAASVYEASSTSKEIAASANRIADTAEEVSAYARNSQTACQMGREELEQAIKEVEELTYKTDDTARRTVELGEKSQKISGIIDIINEISEQTNLLALNAAIEAAGAGEAGKRFSVVAHEIRRLASRTLDSTQIVRQLIEEIQTSTNSTVMVTEQSMKGAKETQEVIVKLNDTFQNILDMVEQTLNASTEINLSTRQQTTACEQMVSTIMEVSDVASEVERGAKEAEEALSTLRELADTLKRLSMTQDD
jgi:methyl-accepting chemotaxis protein